MTQEKSFNKYRLRGSMHWLEMMSRDPRKFNAYQQARYEWILRTMGDIRGRKILDLGCGDGSLTYILTKSGAVVTGVDNEERGLEYARENLSSVDDGTLKYEFINASAYELPFQNESFDAVVSCEVIEHLREPDRMLSESSRVLKKDGKFVLTTPYRITEIPRDPNHVTEYYPSEIRSMLGRFFADADAKSTHHMMWFGLYTYAWRALGRRTVGRWLINIPALFLGWNPFLIDYKSLTKFDHFTSILAWGIKK